MCSSPSGQPEDEDEDESVNDPEGLEPFDYDGPLPGNWDDFVCVSCAAELERRYSRPEHASGRFTLGDLLIENVSLQFATFDEEIDPEVMEVFPHLSRGLARPCFHPLRRSSEKLVEVMARVGRPVAVLLESPVIERSGDGPFAIASPLQDGEYSCCGVAFHLSLVDEFPDCINAHDYAPDGSPLGGT
jgi:hypothetical protein